MKYTKPGSRNKYIQRSRQRRARSVVRFAAARSRLPVRASVPVCISRSSAHADPDGSGANQLALELLLKLLTHLIASATAPVVHEAVERRQWFASGDESDHAIIGQRLQLGISGDGSWRVEAVRRVLDTERELIFAPLLQQPGILRRIWEVKHVVASPDAR